LVYVSLKKLAGVEEVGRVEGLFDLFVESAEFG
jgi:hypothetical protein